MEAIIENVNTVGTSTIDSSNFYYELYNCMPSCLYGIIWRSSIKSSQWFRTIDEVIELIRSDSENVYISAGLSPKNFGKYKRCPQKQIAGIVALWIDLDVAGPGHKQENLPPDFESLRNILDKFPLEPSAIIHTGGGLQAWWFLDEPWIFSNTEDREAALDLSYRLNCTFKQLAAPYTVDSVHNLDRLMRAPGTVNYKEDRGRRDVVIESMTGKRYTPLELDAVVLPLDQCPPRTECSAIAINTQETGLSVIAGDFKLDPNAQPDSLKLQALIDADPRFSMTWDKKRDKSETNPNGFPSPSEYDLALASFAVAAEWNDQEIVDLLIAWRTRHGCHPEKILQRPDYVRSTIAKARSGGMVSSSNRGASGAKAIIATTGIKLREIIAAAHQGERSCAELFIVVNRKKFCFDHAEGAWYEFQGHHWASEDIGEPIRACDDLQELFRLVLSDVKKEITQKEQKQRKINGHVGQVAIMAEIKKLRTDEKAIKSAITRLNDLNFRKRIIEFAAQGAKSLGIDGKQWDRHPWWLACKNGVVDLKTGKLRHGMPEDYIRSYCPHDYDPQATCPLFEKFLIDIFDGDHSMVEYVQKLFGLSLIGDATMKQYLIILEGEGRNGKDTLVGAISNAVGPQLCGIFQPELLLDSGKYGKRGAHAPSPEIMALHGKRIMIGSETSEGRSFDVGKAKWLTGGGDLTGRHLFGKREITFMASHLIFLMTNSLPGAPAEDYAFWQRVQVIPFRLRYEDNPQKPNERKKDEGLKDKLKSEALGILCWLVDGCLQYQRNKLAKPQAVEVAGRNYINSVDLIQDFIDDCCLVGASLKVKAKNLYERYKMWCKAYEITPVSIKKFSKQLISRGFHKTVSNGVWYHGISLRR